MRRVLTMLTIGLTTAVVVVSAQTPTWRPGNRSMTSAQEKEAAAKAKTLPLKARDLSGVWGLGANGFNLDQRAVPPMTPEGKARYDAAKPGLGPRGVPLGNDPLMICDPVGYPRSFTYNYGMEFIETPGRTLQFFEWGHTWRTIWTDGRALPTEVESRGGTATLSDAGTAIRLSSNPTGTTSAAGSTRTGIPTAPTCAW